jgi:drug/metabolite transporter (DMT)-like permease
MDRRLSGLAGLALISGTSFLFIKVAVRDLHPLYVTFGRVAVAAVVLLGVLAARRERLPRDPRYWGHVVIAAAVGLVLPFTLFGYAEQHTSSALAGIWNATTPLFVLPLAAFAFRTERFTGRSATGLVVGFVGVLVVLGVWHSSGDRLGQLLCLGAAAGYGVGIPYQKRFLSKPPPVATAAAQLLVAAVPLGVIAPLVAGPPAVTLPAGLSVLVLGVLGTAAGFLLSLHNIRTLGATGAATVTFLIPVVAVLAGLVVLGERLTWYQPLGALIVLSGVATQSRSLKASWVSHLFMSGSTDGSVSRNSTRAAHTSPRSLGAMSHSMPCSSAQASSPPVTSTSSSGCPR